MTGVFERFTIQPVAFGRREFRETQIEILTGLTGYLVGNAAQQERQHVAESILTAQRKFGQQFEAMLDCRFGH